MTIRIMRQWSSHWTTVSVSCFKVRTSGSSIFDLKADIGERHDLSERKPSVAERLRNKLHAWRKRVNAQMPRPNPDYDPEAPFRDAYWMPNP